MSIHGLTYYYSVKLNLNDTLTQSDLTTMQRESEVLVSGAEVINIWDSTVTVYYSLQGMQQMCMEVG